MKHSQGAMVRTIPVRTLVGDSSGPHALLGFNCLSTI